MKNLLTYHKHLLKTEIFRKRALMEEQMLIDIQEELTKELSTYKRDETKKPHKIKVGRVKRKSNAHLSQKAGPSTSRCGEAKRHKGLQESSNKLHGVSSAAAHQYYVKKDKLCCLCKMPCKDTEFCICCYFCNDWFHGDCVGIIKETTTVMAAFVCTLCHDGRETQECFCICKKPYDESQFYIYCDICEDWFHGRCLGILQSEAEAIDEYACPNCDRDSLINFTNMKDLNNADLDILKKLMKQILAHKSAWPFVEPVDPKEAPNYYKVIKEPMDLQTMELRIENKTYKRLSEFIGDMTKIFENCRYYNPKDSKTPHFKCAQSLETFFASKIKSVRKKMFEEK